MTRVKICGITRIEDAEIAIEEGAHALGFVMEPSSPRYVGDETDLPSIVPPLIETVAVFASFRPEASLRGIATIQSLDDVGAVSQKTIRVFRVGENNIAEIEEYVCGALLLDAHHPDSLGGTGTSFDWEIAAEIVRSASVPVILAGGLTPDNVQQAINQVNPYAVDVSSGVEATPGIKDAGKVRAFLQAVREA